MTALALALLMITQAGTGSFDAGGTGGLDARGTGSLEAGLAALRDGRYEEAVRLLEQATSAEPTYDGLVGLGLARGRLQRLAEAGAAFDRAITLDPGRPEAWVERGGLRFLEKRYEGAVHDLERALARREDPYTRDLLASSLHLAGQTDEAVACWNAMGQPLIRNLEIEGLVHTRDTVARRELALAEGELLDLRRLRESRLRLAEVGVFDRVTLRPIPLGGGKADLHVALSERHGFYSTPVDLGLGTAVNLLFRRVSVRYWNLAGEGVSVEGQYRWESTRPEVALIIDWPRPLGIPAKLRVRGFHGEQEYDLGASGLRRRSRGLDFGFRRVLGTRTVAELGMRTRDRSFSRPAAFAPSGGIVGLEGVVEEGLVESRRHRLQASLRLFRSTSALGSDLRYTRGLFSVRYKGFLAPVEGTVIERSLVAAELRLGKGDAGMPLDEMFAPGGSPDMDLPLRAHHQDSGGVLGAAPIGRSLVLGNVEWRQRIHQGLVQVGFALFYDGARIAQTALGPDRTLHDIGLGLRLSLGRSTVLRFDYGHGVSDGKNAFFAGLREVF